MNDAHVEARDDLLQTIRVQATELAKEYRDTVKELKQGEQHPTRYAHGEIREFVGRLKASQTKLGEVRKSIDALQRAYGAGDARLGALHSMDNIVRTLHESQQMVCETASNYEQGDELLRYEHVRGFALKEQAAADDMDKIVHYIQHASQPGMPLE